jgi:hypothetical protein
VETDQVADDIAEGKAPDAEFSRYARESDCREGDAVEIVRQYRREKGEA